MFTLVLGGAGSGKSKFSEDLMLNFSGTSAYIATMESFGKEAEDRIEKHRLMRKDKGFFTIEKSSFVNGDTAKGFDNCLLECVSNLLANHIFSEKDDHAFENITSGLLSLRDHSKNLVIVSNEIFSDGCAYDPETLKYIETLGKINCFLAKHADYVYEVVVGIPIKLKGEQ